ncbi:MAG: MATE family efflux transporter [Faecalibacterium sp.]|nr:MATE family efflux transporter [Faecalibacterium sp.]
MAENKDFLGTEPVGKLMLKLSVPAIAAQLINMLYNIVDRIYIGHMGADGALALTGVGVTTPIIIVVSAFAALVASGASPRASIEMGRGDHKAAERILGAGFALLLVISAVLTAMLLVFGRPLLLLFGASENTIVYAYDYLGIYALGTVFVQLTLGMNAFITAQGDSKTSMLTVLIGAVCNILLDPVFIFVLGMGVKGAALATILSQGISCVWVLKYLTGKKSRLQLHRENIKLDKKILGPVIALGVSPFIMQASESIISVCFNSSLLKYGGDLAVGAMTICTTVMQFAMMPMQGFAQGAQPISSYNFGARNAARVSKTFRLLLTCCLSYSVLLWGCVQLFPQVFAGLFATDAALLEFASAALRVYTGAMFIMGIQISCQMTFISLGNAVSSVIVAVFRKFVILIPLIYLLPVFLADKTFAVYLAEPVADACACMFTVFLFSREFKKAMKRLGEPAAPAMID